MKLRKSVKNLIAPAKRTNWVNLSPQFPESAEIQPWESTHNENKSNSAQDTREITQNIGEKWNKQTVVPRICSDKRKCWAKTWVTPTRQQMAEINQNTPDTKEMNKPDRHGREKWMQRPNGHERPRTAWNKRRNEANDTVTNKTHDEMRTLVNSDKEPTIWLTPQSKNNQAQIHQLSNHTGWNGLEINDWISDNYIPKVNCWKASTCWAPQHTSLNRHEVSFENIDWITSSLTAKHFQYVISFVNPQHLQRLEQLEQMEIGAQRKTSPRQQKKTEKSVRISNKPTKRRNWVSLRPHLPRNDHKKRYTVKTNARRQ